jgi:hypothetical protein
LARPPSWLPRLHEIRRSVSGSVRTHYDRPALEQLFQLQPRAAGKLLEILPQVEALGRSRLVERAELVRFLDRVHEAEDVTAAVNEQRGEKRISHRKPRLLVRRELIDQGGLPALPETVVLERGRLEVRFGSKLELIEQLAMIVGAVENDEAEFLAQSCRRSRAPKNAGRRTRSCRISSEISGSASRISRRIPPVCTDSKKAALPEAYQ